MGHGPKSATGGGSGGRSVHPRRMDGSLRRMMAPNTNDGLAEGGPEYEVVGTTRIGWAFLGPSLHTTGGMGTSATSPTGMTVSGGRMCADPSAILQWTTSVGVKPTWFVSRERGTTTARRVTTPGANIEMKFIEVELAPSGELTILAVPDIKRVLMTGGDGNASEDAVIDLGDGVAFRVSNYGKVRAALGDDLTAAW